METGDARPHLVARTLCNVGGSSASRFLMLSLLTAKEGLRSTERGSLQVLAVL